MSIFEIYTNKKYGFINVEGKVVIRPQFEKVYKFSEGLAWASIQKGNELLAGFINEAGEWAIEPSFSGLGLGVLETIHFAEGFAPVQATNGAGSKKMLFINKKGDPITDAIYDHAYPFSEGRALVVRDGLCGYIDHTGAEVIKCLYGKSSFWMGRNSSFSEGLALVRFSKEAGFDENKEGNLGYINKEGDTVIEPQFIHANAFSEGFSLVKNPGYFEEYFFINRKGEATFERTTQISTYFEEGLADMYDEDSASMGFIDATGEWVIPPQFTQTLRFSQGLAAVKSESPVLSKTGYIDRSGEVVIPGRFDTALSFENGLAMVEEDGKKGYINKSGAYVWHNK